MASNMKEVEDLLEMINEKARKHVCLIHVLLNVAYIKNKYQKISKGVNNVKMQQCAHRVY